MVGLDKHMNTSFVTLVDPITTLFFAVIIPYDALEIIYYSTDIIIMVNIIVVRLPIYSLPADYVVLL